MAKTLRAYTVIPSHLYVERKADRQVGAILEDMGRPGYVLVARQMGKTNLILNAKRVHNNQGDIFVYLDVSNKIPDFQLFLRNIIDVAVTQATGIPDAIKKSIFDRRKDCVLLPHKEHEHELATILNHITGKLVICLDEIDALSSSPYSDQVFSFIRSIYFSGRANFDCFDRLTYLLSGVAEPSDIIKNKDVSPFNIGEKIYLEDFSEAELNNFLSQASLNIDQETRSHIYRWTNGHPRMTWDVCSLIEDYSKTGRRIDSIVVDEAVQELYFSNVDVPPVDHIKRMVEEHRDVRDALIAIHYGRSESISDGMRTKLYLAGISQIDLTKRSVHFKNRILEEALSENFLVQLEPNPFDSVLLLIEQLFMKAEYREALAELKKISNSATEATKVWLLAYWSAKLHFRLGAYDTAIKFLEDARPLTSSEAWLSDFYIGTSFFRLGKYEQAKSFLEKLKPTQEQPKDGSVFYEAKSDLAICYLELKTFPLTELEFICVAILESRSAIVNGVGLEKSPAITLTNTYSALARIKKSQGKVDAAIKDLEIAEAFAQGACLLKLHLLQAEFASNEKRKLFAIEKCVPVFLGISQISLGDTYDNNFIALDFVYKLLYELSRLRRVKSFDEVLAHLIKCAKDDVDAGDAVNHLGGLAVTSGNQPLAVQIINGVLSIADEEIPVALTRNLLGITMQVDVMNVAKNANKFIQTFVKDGQSKPLLVDALPLYLIYTEAQKQRNSIMLESVMRLIADISLEEAGLPDTQLSALSIFKEYIVLHNDLKLARDTGNLAKGRNLTSRLNEIRKFDLPNFRVDFARTLQFELNQLIARQGGTLHQRVGRKLGRNDVVLVDYDGALQKGKYKRFIADLENGSCKLVEDRPPEFALKP